MSSFQLAQLHESAIMPKRGTPLSLGLDLHALAIREDGNPTRIIVPPRTTRVIPTGWAIRPPQPYTTLTTEGPKYGDPWLAAVCSRGGLASKGIFVANAPGIIDPDYRGEICVLLYNGGQETYYVSHGDRVAQLVMIQSAMLDYEIVDTIDVKETLRGEGRLGFTGQ